MGQNVENLNFDPCDDTFSANAFSTIVRIRMNDIDKGRDLTQSYDKSPYTHRKIKKQRENTKNATKNFEYTTIADRLRTVSWSNESHPTGMVKLVSGSQLSH